MQHADLDRAVLGQSRASEPGERDAGRERYFKKFIGFSLAGPRSRMLARTRGLP